MCVCVYVCVWTARTGFYISPSSGRDDALSEERDFEFVLSACISPLTQNFWCFFLKFQL